MISFPLKIPCFTEARGNQSCDFEWAKAYYEQDSEDISNQSLYGSCLVIKGEDDKGLPILHYLADFKDDPVSSFFWVIIL